MNNEEKSIYTLIPIEDFKSVLGIDDRDDKLARFCLVTGTLTIEQYCKRRLLRKKYFERIELSRGEPSLAYARSVEYNGDLVFFLREYPVSNILAVYLFGNGELGTGSGNILEPEFYCIKPDYGTDIDIPFSIEVSPILKRYRGLTAVKVVYWAGYVENPHPCGFSTRSFCEAKTPTKASITAASMPQIPADLSAACLELASWNFNRYRSRRVGMTGNIKGAGKEGEHFEMSMPENVKQLLEPYRRKTI